MIINKENIRDIKKNNLAFFIGAGISKTFPADSLDWKTFRKLLIDGLLEKLYNNNIITFEQNQSYSKKLNEADLKPEIVNQQIYWIIKKDLFPIFDIFQQGMPNLYHKAIAQMAKQGKLRVIVTTNFDTYIEEALKNKEGMKEGKSYFVCYDDKSLSNYLSKLDSDKVFIFKIHGTFIKKDSKNEYEGIISTLLESEQPLLAKKDDALRTIMEKNNLLLMGYSGNDSDINPKLIEYARKYQEIYWWIWPEEKDPIILSRINQTIEACEGKAHKIININLDQLLEFVDEESKEILEKHKKDSRNNGNIDKEKNFKRKKDFLDDWLSSKANYKLLMVLAYILEYIGEIKEAMICVDKALEDESCKSDNLILGTALHFKATLFFEDGKYDEALNLFKKSLTVLPKKEMLEIGRIHNNIGVTYSKLKRHKTALQYFKKGYKYAKKAYYQADDLKLISCYEQATSLGNIGNIYIDISIEKAIKYLMESYKSYEEIASVGKIGPAVELAKIYISNKMDNNAKEILKKEKDIFINYCSIGNTIPIAKKMLEIGDIYFKLYDLDEWLEFYSYAFKIGKFLNDISFQSFILFSIAERCTSIGEKSKCIKFFESQLEFYEKDEKDKETDLPIISRLWFGMAMVSEKFKDYSAARIYVQNAFTICEKANDKDGKAMCDKLHSKIMAQEMDFEPELFTKIDFEKIILLRKYIKEKAISQSNERNTSIELEASSFISHHALDSNDKIVYSGSQPLNFTEVMCILLGSYPPELSANILIQFPQNLRNRSVKAIIEIHHNEKSFRLRSSYVLACTICLIENKAEIKKIIDSILDETMLKNIESYIDTLLKKANN